VFRVTDSPEIHSADFHIRFDVNSGPLGYILPHWVDDEQSYCSDEYVTESDILDVIFVCFHSVHAPSDVLV